MGIIYKVTEIETGLVYIGQTTTTLATRRSGHLRDAANSLDGYGCKFHVALRDNPPDCWLWEVIEADVSPESLDRLECEHIAKHDSFANGYNSTRGGSGVKDSAKSIKQWLLESAASYLTPHQMRVLTLYLDGNCQMAIASIMGCHQTAVHKALFGSRDYSRNGIAYGGIVKKLRKHLLPPQRACSDNPIDVLEATLLAMPLNWHESPIPKTNKIQL